MTIAALAAAQLLADDVDAWGMPMLRALLPLAGMTLIEQQAERARAAGVTCLLVLVDGVPPALAEACDRIRARGLTVELVRSGADVLRLAHGHDRLMLVADGLVAGDQAWAASMSARVPALLVTADVSVTQGLERIDAMSRWAGLASLPIAALSTLESAPRDWDPQLLLFRAAVQEGASRIAVDSALFVSGDMMVADSAEALVALERRLLSARADAVGGFGRRYFVGPVVRLFAGRLLGHHRSGVVARILAPLAFLAAATSFLMEQPWIAVGLGLAGVFADEVAVFVAQFRSEGRLWSRLGAGALVLQLLALLVGERGATLAQNGSLIGTGTFPLVLLVAMAALSKKLQLLADDALAWVLLAVLPLLTGWQATFDWAAMIALTLLLAVLVNIRPMVLPWRRGDATKKA